MSMQTINFDVLNLQQNDRILDLGCGEGRHAISAYMLADVESVGIDLSQKDLTTTRERHQEFLDPNNHNRSLVISVASGAACRSKMRVLTRSFVLRCLNTSLTITRC